MKELGTKAAEAHRDLGNLAGQVGFHQIYFIGEDQNYFAEGLKKSNYKGETFIQASFESKLGEKLKESLVSGDLVVIKGSRGAETERFIEFCQPKDWSAKK